MDRGPIDRRQACKCLRADARFNRILCAWRIEDEAVGESSNTIGLSFTGEYLPTLAKLGEDFHAVAESIFDVDLRQSRIFATDDDCGPRDVFEARVFDPQLFNVFWFDLNRGRHVLEGVVYQREARLMLHDRCLPLSLEGRVQESELPSGRRPARHDPVLA